MLKSTVTAFALSLTLAGCGAPQSSQPAAPPAAEPTAAAEPALPDKPWAELTHDEELLVMKKVVMPKAAALFQEADPTKYADVRCTLCHGEGAKQGNFEMPNPELPKLDLSQGFEALRAKNPAAFDFMKDKLTPAMVEALRVPPYDPATHTGFGCLSCHTAAQAQ